MNRWLLKPPEARLNLTAADKKLLRALIRAGSGYMVHDLAAKLGVTEAAVTRGRARLDTYYGLVDRSRTGGFAFYKLTDEGKKVARRV